MGRLLNRANTRSNRFILSLMTLQENDTVLEIGFGGADLLFQSARQVQSGSVTGVELSAEMLARARRAHGDFVLPVKRLIHRKNCGSFSGSQRPNGYSSSVGAFSGRRCAPLCS